MSNSCWGRSEKFVCFYFVEYFLIFFFSLIVLNHAWSAATSYVFPPHLLIVWHQTQVCMCHPAVHTPPCEARNVMCRRFILCCSAFVSPLLSVCNWYAGLWPLAFRVLLHSTQRHLLSFLNFFFFLMLSPTGHKVKIIAVNLHLSCIYFFFHVGLNCRVGWRASIINLHRSLSLWLLGQYHLLLFRPRPTVT